MKFLHTLEETLQYTVYLSVLTMIPMLFARMDTMLIRQAS